MSSQATQFLKLLSLGWNQSVFLEMNCRLLKYNIVDSMFIIHMSNSDQVFIPIRTVKMHNFFVWEKKRPYPSNASIPKGLPLASWNVYRLLKLTKVVQKSWRYNLNCFKRLLAFCFCIKTKHFDNVDNVLRKQESIL